MKDIDYFSEQLMYDKYLPAFHKSLPAKLKKIFEEAYGKAGVTKEHFFVLRGYRGPSHLCTLEGEQSQSIDAKFGVQEIKFQHGFSKILNIINPIGLAFTNLRSVTGWYAIHFDEESGEILEALEAERIQNENKVANEHEKSGDLFLLQKNYEEAAKEYEKAYDISHGHSRKTNFKIKMENAKSSLAVMNQKKGKILWNEAWASEENAAQLFNEAFELFKEASKLDPENSKHAKLKEMCRLKTEGDELVKQGKELFTDGLLMKDKTKFHERREKFKSAKEKFAQGFKISSDSRFQISIKLTESYVKKTDELIRKLQGNSETNYEIDSLDYNEYDESQMDFQREN